MADQDNSNKTPFGANDLSTNPLGTAGNAISGLLASLQGQLQQAYPPTSNPNGVNIGGVDVSQGTPPPQSPNGALNQIFPNLQQGANLQANSTSTLQSLTQPVSTSQQIAQDAIKKAYTQKVNDSVQQLPHQILGKMIDSWNSNGGTQTPYSTPPGAPTAASAAQSVNPNQSGALSLPGVSPQQNTQPSTQANTKPNAPSSGNSNNPSDNNKSWVGTPGDPIQEKAMQIAQQKPGLLGSIFKGVFYNDQKMQLANLKEAQEISQGGPPLSPEKRAEAIGSWNSALLKQHQDFQSDLSEQLKANMDAQSNFIKNTPLPTKATEWPQYSAQLQQYSTNAYQITGKMQEGFDKYKKMSLTNPVTGQKAKSTQDYSGITKDMARQEIANRIKNRQRGN